MTSNDSDEPVHLPSMTRVLVIPLWKVEAEEGICDQQRLGSDFADARADLSFGWLHKFYCRFCHALAHFLFF